MRILLTVLVWLVCIGGLHAFLQYRQSHRPERARPQALKRAEGEYALEIVSSFAVEPDPFAVRIGEEKAAALTVRAAGAEVLRLTERLPGDTPVRLEPVPHLLQGLNEFYIEASPPPGGGHHALRVRLLRGKTMVAQESYWGEGGAVVGGVFRFTLASDEAEEVHER